MADNLTSRQSEVLRLLQEGHQIRAVADHMGITRNAVYDQIKTLKRKGALDQHWTATGEIRAPAGSEHSREILDFVTGAGPIPNSGSSSALEVIRSLTDQNGILLAQNDKLIDMVDRLAAR